MAAAVVIASPAAGETLADCGKEAGLERFWSAWFTAVERGDVDGTMALLSRDFVIQWPLSPPIKDAARLESALTALHGSVDQKVEWTLEEAGVHGQWAWTRVTETARHFPKAGGAPRTLTGSHLSILRCERDGWRLHRETGALDRMP